jgi:hypothetical protein
MGEITARNRGNSPIEGLPEGARLLERVARPLNGMEIKEALRRHLTELGNELTEIASTRIRFGEEIDKSLNQHNELNKLNIVYPGVGWFVTVILEELPQGEIVHQYLQAHVQLDLQHDKRKEIQVGLEGRGIEVERREDEQLQSKVPDKIRQERGLDVVADYTVPATGARGQVKMARSVEVGQAAQRPQVIIPEPPKEIGQPSPPREISTLTVTELPVEDLIGAPTKEAGGGKRLQIRGSLTKIGKESLIGGRQKASKNVSETAGDETKGS